MSEHYSLDNVRGLRTRVRKRRSSRNCSFEIMHSKLSQITRKNHSKKSQLHLETNTIDPIAIDLYNDRWKSLASRMVFGSNFFVINKKLM